MVQRQMILFKVSFCFLLEHSELCTKLGFCVDAPRMMCASALGYGYERSHTVCNLKVKKTKEHLWHLKSPSCNRQHQLFAVVKQPSVKCNTGEIVKSGTTITCVKKMTK